MHAETLRAHAEALGVPLDEAQLGGLLRLLDLWRRYGRSMNLTGATTDEALVEHVKDGIETVACARAVGPVDATTRWIDVGSGGGFPGLIVAAITEVELVLVEPRQKRAGFLELALGMLRRGRAVVKRGRLERSTWGEISVDGKTDWTASPSGVATARAVWEPVEWLEMGRTMVGEGGAVLAHVPHGWQALSGWVECARVAGTMGDCVALKSVPQTR